jgi:CRP-like cAMP-binding protein
MIMDVDEPAPPPDGAAELMRLVVSLIESSPLLAVLDSNAMRILAQAGTREHYELDDEILAFGHPGSSLFLILEGEVVVELPGEPPVELAVLRAGAFFGESSIITALPRNASVRALGPATVLELPRAAVREMVAACPAVLDVLMRFFRARLVATVLVTSPLFSPFGTEERRKLVGEFRMRELAPGGVVLEAGSEGPGLFLLLAGRLEVVAATGAILGELAQGEVFGEMSLLGGGAATAEVRAHTRAWVLLLPVATYRALAPQHPELERGLKALSATRQARNARKR